MKPLECIRDKSKTLKRAEEEMKTRWHPYFMMVSRAVIISARGGINQNTSYLSESVIPFVLPKFQSEIFPQVHS